MEGVRKRVTQILTRWFKPDLRVRKVAEIPLDELWERGVRILFVDLDGTLAPAGEIFVPDETSRWVERARERGFVIIVVSNAINPVRVLRVSRTLRVAGVPLAAKPRRFVFLRCLGVLGLSPSQGAVIGDQLFTDILGGKRAGLMTVLVEPVGKRAVSGWLQGPFEKWIMRWLGKEELWEP